MARRRAGEIDRIGYRRLRIRHLLADIGQRKEAERLTDAQCDRLYVRFVEVYEEEWVAFADVLPTLQALHDRRVPVAAATNGPEERQQRKARVLGIAPWVLGVWTSQHLAAKKPDPATYLAVCEAIDAAPASVLHVGDNAEHDLHGALAAGLPALQLDRGQTLPATPHRITGLDGVLARL